MLLYFYVLSWMFTLFFAMLFLFKEFIFDIYNYFYSVNQICNFMKDLFLSFEKLNFEDEIFIRLGGCNAPKYLKAIFINI
jgi:hypothetical protein